MNFLFVLLSTCGLLLRGVFGVEEITLTDGDLVTLLTGVKTNQQQRLRWFFNDIRIAQITGDVSKTCTDVQCDERFRDRLEMDDQTGSLTIRRIVTSDAGLYKWKILGSPGNEKIFNVTVHDQMKKVSVKERESVTLCTDVVNPEDMMKWCFNDTLIAEITGHPKKIYKVHYKDGDERFRDRLELDQTGSLTIRDIRNTDSGEYKLQINSSSSWIIRSFSVAVDSHAETPAGDIILFNKIAVFVGAVLLSLTVAVAIFIKYGSTVKRSDLEQKNMNLL